MLLDKSPTASGTSWMSVRIFDWPYLNLNYVIALADGELLIEPLIEHSLADLILVLQYYRSRYIRAFSTLVLQVIFHFLITD